MTDDIATMTYIGYDVNKQISVAIFRLVCNDRVLLTHSLSTLTWWQRIMDPNVPLPEKFQGDWSRWLQRFERYRIISGLCKKSQADQVATMFYAIGDKSEDLIKTLDIDEQKDSYARITKKISEFYDQKINIIAETARFNKRCQREGEPVEDFIHDLHHIAERCNYGNLREELIRDRIVVGVCDDRLSEKLQSQSKLTLAEAIRISRQAESYDLNKDILRSDCVTSVHDVTSGKRFSSSSRPSTSHQNSCSFCGKSPSHPRS
jgi:hypothetical protein